MTENINTKSKGFFIDLLELLKLIVIFTIKKLNIQHCLFFIAFLIFGVGDGITAAYMMEKLGTSVEMNPLMSYVFTEHGILGVVVIKISLTLLWLFSAYVVSLKSKGDAFWTVNGFLIATCVGGVLSINANLNTINGLVHEAPEEIIVIYMVLIILLTEAGSHLDKRARRLRKEPKDAEATTSNSKQC
jgi:hypothetical protein